LTQSLRDEEFSAFVIGRRVGMLRSACLLTAGDPHLAEDLVSPSTAARRMRAAVVLRHWMDLSVEETADLLHCSEGTVKSQTAKAITRLRGLLDGVALHAEGSK